MKIFIPTKNRFETIQTHKIFSAHDEVFILVHNQEQAREYLKNATINGKNVTITNTVDDAFGLTRQREWACANLLAPGEWCIFADDNINTITAVDEKHYKYGKLPIETPGESGKWRDIYETNCSSKLFLQYADECIAMAEQVHAHLVGFATVSNPFFRGKKWRQVGYVIGKLMVWHNVGVPFNHTITMEDFYHTAEHLKRFGTVLINNYIYPNATHYNSGGMGTKDERLPYRKRDVVTLCNMYKGLLKIKMREDGNPDLSVCLNSLDQVKKWRKGVVQ